MVVGHHDLVRQNDGLVLGCEEGLVREAGAQRCRDAVEDGAPATARGAAGELGPRRSEHGADGGAECAEGGLLIHDDRFPYVPKCPVCPCLSYYFAVFTVSLVA